MKWCLRPYSPSATSFNNPQFLRRQVSVHAPSFSEATHLGALRPFQNLTWSRRPCSRPPITIKQRWWMTPVWKRSRLYETRGGSERSLRRGRSKWRVRGRTGRVRRASRVALKWRLSRLPPSPMRLNPGPDSNPGYRYAKLSSRDLTEPRLIIHFARQVPRGIQVVSQTERDRLER